VDASPESSPETQAPSRPADVPEAGVWNAEAGKWEVSRKDGQGARDGECLLYRDDGTLYARHHFVAGLQDGPFFIYHRNGEVAREGRYVAGRVDGTVTAYVSDDPQGERLRACCVPPGAARLCERYREGEYLLELFYDRQGRVILSDGRLCPARPEGLPDLAHFDESRGGWTQRSREIDRFWDENGTLIEEYERGRDGARVVRHFDAGGAPREEASYAGDDRLDGPFWRRFPAEEPSPFADGRIRQERGAYAGGQPVGIWTFLDADGQIVRTVDRGAAFAADGDGGSPVLTAAPADGDWPARARSLAAEGRVREALVAAARGAAAARDRTVFERLRDAHVVPLNAEREAQWGEALSQATDATDASVLDALVSGADGAACLRALAAVLPGFQPAAADLVEASLLLAPERRMTHLTRALLRFQGGDLAGALTDADVVGADSAEAAASLRSYGAIVFRAFDAWPWREAETFTADPELEGVVLEPAHEADDVLHVIGVYATRLEQARLAIRGIVTGAAAPPWLPPDLSHLLPSGPIALRHETVECEPEPESDGQPIEPGGAPETIEIDERLITDGAGVPALLSAAHADWSALSWLCWAVGLDGIVLPDAVGARAELSVAMKMFVRRTWRIKDRLVSGSLVSRSQGVPGFIWQDVDIDELPRHLAEMAAAEYVAVRSMFIWLASVDAVSPFQDDIRDA
jgi:hypothetical protein